MTKKCTKIYLGLAKGEWKSRFCNYKLSCKHKRRSNKTTLLKKHLKVVRSEISTTILKYLEEMPLALILKIGNCYLSKHEGTLEQET